MNPIGRLSGLQIRYFTGLATASLAVFASLPLHAQEDQAPTERQTQKKFIVKLVPPRQKQYCNAGSTIEYFQNDDIAAVTGEITNEQCGASSGTYTMNVRYRDQEGELQELDFDESWQREDDQTVKFKREYRIGKNVDLIRVRTRRMRCVCAEIDDENEAGNQE